MGYIPLHLYSGHSILRSGISLQGIVSCAKKNGYGSCGICDYQTMSSFPEFYHRCVSNGIAPVFGMDMELDGTLLSAYVKSEEGYTNLMFLCLLCSKGTLTLEEIKKKQEGLHFVLDSGMGPFYRYLQAGDRKGAAEWLASFAKGLDHFALGIPYLPNERAILFQLREFLLTYPYDFLAYPHILYEKEDDAIAVQIMKAIGRNETLLEKKAKGTNYFLKQGELESYYSIQELYACETFAESCRFDFLKKRGQLLVFPHDPNLTSGEYLKEKSFEGLAAKGKGDDPIYIERLNYELSVIDKMGYSDYMLIVSDYVEFAKTHDISVGPGRGSGAGSLVSYCLGIVSSDPIEHGLLFERFLNPERQSMPDIDLDFPDNKRSLVVAYLQRKYGYDHVSHIMTFQNLGAKGSLTDIGRVFGYESRHIEHLKSLVDSELTLRENYKRNAPFRQLIDSDSFYLEIVALAAKIESLPRQQGLHASGIVVNASPLETAIPVAYREDVGYIALFEGNYLEEQGFLKMDLLGLKNLALVDHCIDLIEKNHGIRLNYQSLPFEDKQAIELIARGKTMGLFQLSSPGMKRAIGDIKPTCFDDIVAVIALFRPGPMESIPSYGRRKAGIEKITYLSPLLEPILSTTYGIIVYQEQIMQIVRAMAGFSYGQADLFRRAIAKKDALKLSSLRDGFLVGCQNQGVPRDVAERTYQLIFKFADYGFNKSHALAYSVLACQMAYLKSHYPTEFYAAILDGTSSGDKEFTPLISEVKSEGISLSLPYINDAGVSFVPKDNAILFPLTAIRGMQQALCIKIVEERELNGPYEDIFDFACRNLKNGLNVQNLVKFIDAGCFDQLDSRRASLRLAASSAVNFAEMVGGSSGQGALLDLAFPKPIIKEIKDDKMENLTLEKDCLGMMLSGSPLEMKREQIALLGLAHLRDALSTDQELVVAAIIKSCKKITTKKNTTMAFVTLYDEEREIEGVLFEEAYAKAIPYLKEGNLVKARVRKNLRREGYIIEELSLL